MLSLFSLKSVGGKGKRAQLVSPVLYECGHYKGKLKYWLKSVTSSLKPVAKLVMAGHSAPAS